MKGAKTHKKPAVNHRHKKQKSVLKLKWAAILGTILVLLGLVFLTGQKGGDIPYSQVPSPQCLGSCLTSEEYANRFLTIAPVEPENIPTPQNKSFLQKLLDMFYQLFSFLIGSPSQDEPGATPPATEETKCARDVKTCPDGSVVKRVAPSCEFEACPGEKTRCPRDIKKCPDGSSVERKLPTCEFAVCPE